MDEPVEIDGRDMPLYPPLDETGYVDLTLIESTMALTPAERIRRHTDFLEFIELARLARIKRYGFDPAADRSPETAIRAES
jgi:hypothetical protein